MGEVIPFELPPERRLELEVELFELELRIDYILRILGHQAISEPLPEWVS